MPDNNRTKWISIVVIIIIAAIGAVYAYGRFTERVDNNTERSKTNTDVVQVVKEELRRGQENIEQTQKHLEISQKAIEINQGAIQSNQEQIIKWSTQQQADTEHIKESLTEIKQELKDD